MLSYICVSQISVTPSFMSTLSNNYFIINFINFNKIIMIMDTCFIANRASLHFTLEMFDIINNHKFIMDNFIIKSNNYS